MEQGGWNIWREEEQQVGAGALHERAALDSSAPLLLCHLHLSSVLQRVAAYCSVLQCVAVCCSALQCDRLECVAVCCRVLQRVVVCCSVLQCARVVFCADCLLYAPI